MHLARPAAPAQAASVYKNEGQGRDFAGGGLFYKKFCSGWRRPGPQRSNTAKHRQKCDLTAAKSIRPAAALFCRGRTFAPARRKPCLRSGKEKSRKATVYRAFRLFWRSKRDLNSRGPLRPYALSRGIIFYIFFAVSCTDLKCAQFVHRKRITGCRPRCRRRYHPHPAAQPQRPACRLSGWRSAGRGRMRPS